MRRYQFLYGIGKSLFICMTLCNMVLVSCYNDDDLKNSISGLEDRVSKLEASLQNVQNDISSLKTLTDALAQNKSIDSVLENEDGSYTVHFSDKTEVTIRNGKDGEDAPQVTVIKDEEDNLYYWGLTDSNGVKSFLKDDKGNKMLVTAVAPQIRINKETKEWEISTNGGKMWEPTGVYASGEATGDTSLFSEVSQDDDYAYFTLKDGTVLKLLKSKELKCEILSGKQYFTNGEEKLIEVEISGISKYTVTKPDGWKASLSGKGLAITAPALDNQYAEMSGKVAILAVAANGQSLITEVPVVIGEAPIVVSIDKQLVSTSLADGVEAYYLGVMAMSEYSSASIAELVNGNSAHEYMRTQPLNKVPLTELLDKEPELGLSYMVWTIPFSENAYQADDVIAVSTAIQAPGTIELKVSDITFEGATVSAVRKGCDIYYTGITDKANYSPEGVIEDLAFDSGIKHYSDYNGPLEGTALDFLPRIMPGTTYVLWTIPYKEEKGYKTEELVTVEIPVPALTYGGTATVNVNNLVATVTSISAEFIPGTDCYQFYYSYMTERVLANYPTDQDVISYLVKNGTRTKTVANLEKTLLESGTKGFLVAVALNNQGQLGSLVKVQADTKESSNNPSIGVHVSAEVGAQSVTFTLTPVGTPVKYRYMHMKISEFKDYPYWGNEEEMKQKLWMNDGVTEIAIASLDNNHLVIGDLLFNTQYVLYIVAVDADGNPSATMTKSTYTSAKPTYVRKESGADLWNASVPKATIDGIEKVGNFYNISYTVTAGTNNKEFYTYVAPDSYFSGKMYDEQIQIVITNGVKETTTYSGTKFTNLPTNINVTWIDTEGRFYEVAKTVVVAPTE